MLRQAVGQSGKSHMFNAISHYVVSQNKHFLYNIFTAPNMWAGQALMWFIDTWIYLASWQFSHILSWHCFHLSVLHHCLPLSHLIFFVCVPVCFLMDCFLLLVHHVCSGCHYYCCWVFLLEYDCGLFLIWARMASNGSVCMCVFSLVVYVFFCCYWHQLDVLSVTCNYSPIVVTCMLYDLLWWLWSSLPTIIPCLHGPLFSHWTATVDPMRIDAKTCEASLFVSFLLCLCINFIWCLSSLSTLIAFLSITGITPHTRWLNRNIARLGRPCPSGVVWICNAMSISPPDLSIFLSCT